MFLVSNAKQPLVLMNGVEWSDLGAGNWNLYEA